VGLDRPTGVLTISRTCKLHDGECIAGLVARSSRLPSPATASHIYSCSCTEPERPGHGSVARVLTSTTPMPDRGYRSLGRG
jgi:hypothetical protein